MKYFLLLSLLMLCGSCHQRQEAEPQYAPMAEPQDTVAPPDTTAVATDATAEPVRSVRASQGHYYSDDDDDYDNMRGFDPASEDDMDDNGMSRYMDNDDDEGWD